MFIGHGDSDKAASINPFSKAYDQVWVAGQAGRDRYLRAQVGVRDEDIVEVGRPQLTGIRTAGEAPRTGCSPCCTRRPGKGGPTSQPSFKVMGLRIVQALLDYSPQIRVLYKPHPLTGTRDRSMRASTRRSSPSSSGPTTVNAGQKAGLPKPPRARRTGRARRPNCPASPRG